MGTLTYIFITAIIIFVIQQIRIALIIDKHEMVLNSERMSNKIINNELRAQLFRPGDRVYINGDEKFQLGKAYFLIKSYNGTGPNGCWYIGNNPDDYHENHRMATHTKNLSMNAPERCDRCRRILEN
jgi:hypothetical protein